MKKIPVFFAIGLIVFFQFCSAPKKTVADTSGSAPAVPAHAAITYSANIEQAITAYCSPCHIPPKGFKLALNTYTAAKTNIGDIITRIKLNPGEKGFMPFKHDKLSDSAINVFVQWQTDGLLEK